MRSESQRSAIQTRLALCRTLRAGYKRMGMAHGQAVALGRPGAEDFLAIARNNRRELKSIQLKFKMYRVLRDAAKEVA